MEPDALEATGGDRRSFLGLALAAAAAPALGLAAENDLTQLTIEQASAMVRKRAVSPVELTQACLRRIEKMNPVLNAFITVTAEQALEQARAAETEIGRGRWRGPLHGIPIALKDLIDTARIKTTAASALYAERIPDRDAEVVRRLKAAGAVLLGKLNMDEFAFSFTSETSHFGPVRNPWKLDHIPGGSSSGSAAAVAGHLCYAALGSDTGGSIREPASFCGIAGLKPTYGLVSTFGVVPLAWTLDHVGPMCRGAWDTAAVLSVIAGYDAADPASVNAPVPDYLGALGKVTGLRLGTPRSVFFEDLDPEVEAAIKAALEVLRRTADIRDVQIPMLQNSPVLAAEAYAFHRATLSKSPEIYHPRIRRNLERGASVPAAAYIHAKREMDALRRNSSRVFDEVDLLITPASPRLPIPLDPARDPDAVLLRNTRPFNYNGLPAMTVPCGFSRTGLPIGLQIAGPRLGETRILALARAFERATDWHKQRPAA